MGHRAKEVADCGGQRRSAWSAHHAHSYLVCDVARHLIAAYRSSNESVSRGSRFELIVPRGERPTMLRTGLSLPVGGGGNPCVDLKLVDVLVVVEGRRRTLTEVVRRA